MSITNFTTQAQKVPDERLCSLSAVNTHSADQFTLQTKARYLDTAMVLVLLLVTAEGIKHRLTPHFLLLKYSNLEQYPEVS